MLTKTKSLPLLLSKPLMLGLCFQLIQQIIVASSTYWIAQLASDITKGEDFSVSLGCFLASLIIVYIPGVVSFRYLEKAKFSVVKKLIDRFLDTHTGKATEWSNKESRQSKSALLASESQITLFKALDFGFDFYAIALNITLNLIVFSYVIDERFLIAYSFAFIVMLAFIWTFKRKLSNAASSEQNKRVDLTQTLSNAWDNVLLGNKINLKTWNKFYKLSLNQAKQASVHALSLSQGLAALAMLLSSLPVFTLIIYLFITHKANLAVLGALVATLPRQVQIIQNFHVIVGYIAELNIQKTKVFNLISKLLETKNTDVTTRIQYQKIVIESSNQKHNVSNWEEFQKLIQSKTAERLTIRGPNGSGKSTLLCLAKEKFTDKAFYLPAKSNLLFESTGSKSLSTGQEIINMTDQILKHVSASIIFLDEWDANLDQESLKKINTKIEELSKNKIVIEVRHRD